MDEVCHHGAADNACDCAPVHLLLRDFLSAICEIVEDEDDAHRRQGAVEDVEPAAEVPVKPYGGNSADDTGDDDHGLLAEAEDIGKAKTCGVKRIVIGGPDVEAQNQNCKVEEVEVEHHLKDVISAHVYA